MTAESRSYLLLDVELVLRGPEEVMSSFDRVYGRFRPPCACPLCEGTQVLQAEVVVEPGAGGRRSVRSTWEQGEVPEDQVFAYLLYLVQNHVIRSSRRFYAVHGACLEIGGRGCVLSAASCVGKTTLALELVRRGAGFLSDEVAAVPVEAGGVHAFPRAVGLRPGSVEVLGMAEAVREGFTDGHGELKHFLDVTALFPDRSRPASSLDVVVLLTPPADEVDRATSNLVSMEISLPQVADGLVPLLERIQGVEHVVRLEGRATETLRVLHRKGAFIVRAMDEAARACGAFISGHHRGRSRAIDYRSPPAVRTLSVHEGVRRLAGNTLNLRNAMTSSPSPVVFGRFAGRFGHVRFVEVTPGNLSATAALVEGVCRAGR